MAVSVSLILMMSSSLFISGIDTYQCDGIPRKYWCSSDFSAEFCEVQHECQTLSRSHGQNSIAQSTINKEKNGNTMELVPKYPSSNVAPPEILTQRIVKKSGKPPLTLSNSSNAMGTQADKENIQNPNNKVLNGDQLGQFAVLKAELERLRTREAGIMHAMAEWERRFIVPVDVKKSMERSSANGAHMISSSSTNEQKNVTVSISQRCLSETTAEFYKVSDYCREHVWPKKPLKVTPELFNQSRSIFNMKLDEIHAILGD